MEDQAGEAAQPGKEPQTAAQCEECKLQPWKYKCPGCFRRTCSLPCVKAHKERSGCTGKKPFNDVVPISQFDDNLLLSDYNMLEDVKRVAESARRMRYKLCGYSQFRLPFPLKSLRSAANSRRTKLLFLSGGMSKREKNRTFYNHRKKYISWSIEWKFHSTDVVLMDHGVHENTKLCTLIEKHLEPGPWKHPLKQFCEVPMDSLKLFIRKYHKGQKAPYRQLDINAPLRQQLSNLVILEYPVVHVFLPSHNIEFEVMKESIPRQVKPKEIINNYSPSHKGVTFKEEEIEDVDSSDPRVSDLIIHHANIEVEEKGTEEQHLSESVDGIRGDQGATPVLDTCSNAEESRDMDLAFLDSMAFEFDPKLIDSYAAELFAEANPEGNLDFGGSLGDEKYLGGGNWADFGDALPAEEELEEGEIAS